MDECWCIECGINENRLGVDRALEGTHIYCIVRIMHWVAFEWYLESHPVFLGEVFVAPLQLVLSRRATYKFRNSGHLQPVPTVFKGKKL